MRRASFAALLVAIALPLQSCETPAPKVVHNAVPGTDFSAYHTYAWLPGMRMPSGMDPIAFQRLQTDVDAAMAQKNYVRGDPGDLTMALTVGVRDYVDPDWHYGNYSYTVGHLSVDAFNTQTRQALWHGQATGSIDRSHLDPARGDAAVAEIMTAFPATTPR